MLKINIIFLVLASAFFSRMFSLGVPPPAALGGVSYRTRRSFCRIRFDLTPRGLRLKNRYLNTIKSFNTNTSLINKHIRAGILKKVRDLIIFEAVWNGFQFARPRVFVTFMAALQWELWGERRHKRPLIPLFLILIRRNIVLFNWYLICHQN